MDIFWAFLCVTLAILIILAFRWVWIMTDWDRPEPRPKWSDWIPTMVQGEPGFEHSRKAKSYDFDTLGDDPEEIEVIQAQFIPLTSFIGKDYKPVSIEEWRKLYIEHKPYKWQIHKPDLLAWRQQQTIPSE